ncbi:hypothetical protein DSO57_1002367 [Entomophthora muscae]|uniref:Uncharacterized protein n=1 Tax=Entomophthora muscae TaxID=34485 RepID=A0ACC2RNM0_9FUNG|nr:hypothetical protein DSO57_1002367 [Entomophthora muscae]
MCAGVAPTPRPNPTIAISPYSMIETLRRPGPQQKASPALVKELRDYVEFAALAYCGYSFDNLTERAKLFAYILNAKTSTHAKVFISPLQKEIIVTFRGSDSFAKLMQVYDSSWAPFGKKPGQFVHLNVFAYTRAIRRQVRDAISDLLYEHPSYRIVLVGHSLGGAIATLMAPFIAKQFRIPPPSIRIITYNQPRVGNRQFAKDYNQLNFNLSRVVNKDDPVPAHPPFQANWTHVQREVYINSENEFYLCRAKGFEDHHCSFKKSSIFGFLHHSYIADLKVTHKFFHPALARDVIC